MDNHRLAAAFAVATIAATPVAAQPAAPQRQMVLEAPKMIANPYADYEFLIGDWYSKPNGGPDVSIHQNFRWGTNKSYIYYTTLTAEGAKPEAIHFEGMAVWNGQSKKLDYIVASEPGSGAQESGTFHVETDGTIVRDVKLTRPDGKTQNFRQTFRKTGADSAVTTLMRQTASGWEPNFPGSERIEMRRQA